MTRWLIVGGLPCAGDRRLHQAASGIDVPTRAPRRRHYYLPARRLGAPDRRRPCRRPRSPQARQQPAHLRARASGQHPHGPGEGPLLRRPRPGGVGARHRRCRRLVRPSHCLPLRCAQALRGRRRRSPRLDRSRPRRRDGLPHGLGSLRPRPAQRRRLQASGRRLRREAPQAWRLVRCPAFRSSGQAGRHLPPGLRLPLPPLGHPGPRQHRDLAGPRGVPLRACRPRRDDAADGQQGNLRGAPVLAQARPGPGQRSRRPPGRHRRHRRSRRPAA